MILRRQQQTTTYKHLLTQHDDNTIANDHAKSFESFVGLGQAPKKQAKRRSLFR